ncbi:MAG: hypothetical protein WAT51_00405 [Holophaga sp.]
MSSQKLLSSVAHNIAHHAVSGLSYLHPHLKLTLVKANLTSIAVDLLNPELDQPNLKPSKPLTDAIGALKSKFAEILVAEGLSLADVRSAVLVFDFPAYYTDNFCSDCHAFLVGSSGKHFQQAVDYLGRSIAPNLPLNPDATSAIRFHQPPRRSGCAG